MKVLIIGAHGKVGQRIAKAMSASEDFEPTAFIRKEEQQPIFEEMGVNTAVESLEKAVSLVPSDPIINDHLGDALWKAGYKNEAIFQWNRALLYSPENEIKKTIKLKLQKGL